MGNVGRYSAASVVIAMMTLVSLLIQDRNLALSLVLGTATGIVFQRGRFCFCCNFTDFLDRRDASGLLAITVALAAGCVLYSFIVSAWLPVPKPPDLPPNAHIGPVGPLLFLSAFIFGCGMTLSGSCLSAHLYRLGEGTFGSLAALSGAMVGFLLGFRTWNWLYVNALYDDRPIWLPHHVGYSGSVAISLALLLGVAFILMRFNRTGPREVTGPMNLTNVLTARWPPVVTGILVGLISAIAYFRVGPLGVTAELGSIVRIAALSAGWMPETLYGLDGLRGCISAVRETLLSKNGLFVIGIIAGSFAASLAAGHFRPSWPGRKKLALNFLGGILLGWGAMISLGCTVGVLLSGIHAGAVSGWVFLLACAGGAWSSRHVLKRISGARLRPHA